MATILSAIMPIHNEERLLPLSLKRLVGAIDELLVIDGGPRGPCTDKSLEIVSSFFPDAIVVRVDRHTSVPFAFEEYLEQASGGYVMRLSADMLLSGGEVLREAIQGANAKVYLCPMCDLWGDPFHVKQNGEGVVDHIPIATAVSVLNARSAIADLAIADKAYLASVLVTHVGWLRPFAAQVQKHVRHIEAGAWSEIGAQVRSLGDRAVESWAVHHVLRYRNSPGLRVSLPRDIEEELADMSFMDGFEEYVAAYEEKYQTEFYAGLMYSVPPELIV